MVDSSNDITKQFNPKTAKTVKQSVQYMDKILAQTQILRRDQDVINKAREEGISLERAHSRYLAEQAKSELIQQKAALQSKGVDASALHSLQQQIELINQKAELTEIALNSLEGVSDNLQTEVVTNNEINNISQNTNNIDKSSAVISNDQVKTAQAEARVKNETNTLTKTLVDKTTELYDASQLISDNTQNTNDISKSSLSISKEKIKTAEAESRAKSETNAFTKTLVDKTTELYKTNQLTLDDYYGILTTISKTNNVESIRLELEDEIVQSQGLQNTAYIQGLSDLHKLVVEEEKRLAAVEESYKAYTDKKTQASISNLTESIQQQSKGQQKYNVFMSDALLTTNALQEKGLINLKTQEELLSVIEKGKDPAQVISTLQTKIDQAYKDGNEEAADQLILLKSLAKVEQSRIKIQDQITTHTDKALEKMTALTDQVPFVGKQISSYLTNGMKRFNETLSKSLVEGERGFSALGKSALKTFGLGGGLLLGLAGLGVALAGVYKFVTAFDDKISETAQSMGTTKEAAMELTLAAGRAGMTQEQHLKAVQALNKAYGGMNVVNGKNADVYKDQLKTVSDLQLGFGLSADEAGELAMVANTLGGDVTTMTGAVLEQVEALEAGGNHLVNQADVLKDISKLGRVNAMIFGKNVTALTKAAAAARMLGTDINSVIASGEKQLDIEESLTQEMRLRVFTGADISKEMDAFREASLFGDPDQLMQAKTDVMSKVNDAIKSGDKAMVGLATKQYAELMGITAEQAAKEFQNLDLVKSMGFDMNEFLKGNVSEDDMLAKRKDLTKAQQDQLDALIKERKSQKLSQEFEEGLTKLKESVAPFLAPLAENLGSIVEGLTHFVEWIAKGTSAISNMAGSLFGFGGATEVTTEQIAAYAAENKVSQDEAKTKLEEKAKAEEESGSSLGAWTAGIVGAGAAFFGLKKAVGAVRKSPFFEAIMGKTEDTKNVETTYAGVLKALQDFHGKKAKSEGLSKQIQKEKPGMIKSFMNMFKRDKTKDVSDKAQKEGTDTGKKPGLLKRLFSRRDKSKQVVEDVQGDASSKKPNMFKRIGNLFKRDKSKQVVEDVQEATPDAAPGKKPGILGRIGSFFKGKGKGGGKLGAIAGLAGSVLSSDLAQDAISTVTGQTPEDVAMAKLTGETSPAGNIVSNLAGGDIGAAAGDLVGGGAGGGALTAGIDAAMAGGGLKDIAGAALGSLFGGGGETAAPEMPAEPELTGDFYSDIFVYLDQVIANLQQIVENTGGGSATPGTPEAESAEEGGGGIFDMAKDLLGKTKIGKKMGLGQGGMMDSMLDMVTGGSGGGGGGGGGSSMGGSSKTPSMPSASGGGGGGGAPKAAPKGGGGFFSRIGSFLSEKLDPSKMFGEKVGGFLKTGFAKALGPIMAAISSISSISSLIMDGKSKLAAGESIDFGDFGKKIVQSAAYPIVSSLITLIPGIGSTITLADQVGAALGFSPIKWLTNNLINLLPNDAFTGLGKFALGVEGEGAQPQTAQPMIEGGMNETVKVQANDFVIEPNSNDKIGGVLDNKSVTEMVGLLQQMVGLLGQRQEVVLSSATANAIVTMGTANKSFKK